MKQRRMQRLMLLAILICLGLVVSTVWAAELLDVKPVTSGGDVLVEVTADVPMTYSYYKIPGEARAVVDIADADPEKVEPLIVVNKGAVASISVDKAQISGMVVSRLVFNLVKEADIKVTAASDRKMLIVAFGGAAAGAASAPPSVPAPPVQASPKKEEVPAPVAAEPQKAVPAEKAEPKEVVAPKPSAETSAAKEDDPLGLDEPEAVPKPVSAQKQSPLVVPADSPPAPPVQRLAPVVPETPALAPANIVIKGVGSGAGYIEIQANGPIGTFKPMRLVKPERLAIDISGAKIAIGAKAVAVNRNGITQVRVGRYPDYARIVLDTSKDSFPAYDIAPTAQGLRITFR